MSFLNYARAKICLSQYFLGKSGLSGNLCQVERNPHIKFLAKFVILTSLLLRVIINLVNAIYAKMYIADIEK